MGLAERLKEKGWSDEEIARVIQTINESDKNSPKNMHVILYWVSIILAIIGNFIICISLIPIFLVLSTLPLYLILGVVGLSFGALFNILIKDLGHVDPKHHIVGGIFLPVLAVIVMYVTVKLTNSLALKSNGVFPLHNVIFIPIIYVIFFMSPFLLTYYKKYRETKISNQK